jgi:hypothetical protein
MAFRFHDLMVNLAGEGGVKKPDDAGTSSKCCPNSPVQQPPECKPQSHHRPHDDDKKKREERQLADLGRLQRELRQALDSAGA